MEMKHTTLFLAILVIVAILVVPVAATTVRYTPTGMNDESIARVVSSEAYETITNGAGTGFSEGRNNTDGTIKTIASTTTNQFTTTGKIGIIVPTADLPDTATINSAALVFYYQWMLNDVGNPGAALTGFAPGTPGVVNYADYNTAMSAPYATSVEGNTLYSGGEGWYALNFTPAGLAAISKTGNTNLLMTSVWDITNTSPTWTSEYESRLVISMSEQAGYGCYLDVDYTDAGGSAPVTAFSANVTSGAEPLGVGFTDSSTNTPTNWDWYFGNGTKFSDLQNPSVSLSDGLYTINLYTSNAFGGDWENKTNYINVTSVDPWAGYIPTNVSGTAPLSVDFTDISYNSPDHWNWSYQNITGDNVERWFSTSQNPTYIFTWGGLYAIRLNASNGYGYNITPPLGYVNVTGDLTVAGFAANTTSGESTIGVAFTDLSTNSPTSWDWYWYTNETKSSSSQNPTATFTTGVYNVRLKSTNPYSSDWENKTAYITVTAGYPIAGFSSNVTYGLSPLGVSFTDATTGTPNNWDWYWSNDETKDSDLQNPTATFTTGLYNVRLYASNADGGSWKNKTAYIAVGTPPVAGFTASDSVINLGTFITFTDTSTNTPTSWEWDFNNDGNTDSISQNPTYAYPVIGTYTVKLTATSEYRIGQRNENQLHYGISCTHSRCSIIHGKHNIWQRNIGGISHRYQYNSPNNWDWYWSDDETKDSDLQNPVATFSDAGHYDVRLYASNSFGGTWHNFSYINVISRVYQLRARAVTAVPTIDDGTTQYYTSLVDAMGIGTIENPAEPIGEAPDVSGIGLAVYGALSGTFGSFVAVIIIGSIFLTVLITTNRAFTAVILSLLTSGLLAMFLPTQLLCACWNGICLCSRRDGVCYMETVEEKEMKHNTFKNDGGIDNGFL